MVLGHVRVLMEVCTQGEGDPFPLDIDEGEQIPRRSQRERFLKAPGAVP